MINIKSNAKNEGFSLIELMVVISIIVILMAIIVGIYLSAKGRRDEKKVLSEMKAIELAIHNFHTEYNYYPPDAYDPDNPGSFDPGMNGLFRSLTQGFEKDKHGSPLKNFLEGTQLKNDGILAKTELIQIGGVSATRVWLGPFGTRSEALREGNKAMMRTNSKPMIARLPIRHSIITPIRYPAVCNHSFKVFHPLFSIDHIHLMYRI